MKITNKEIIETTNKILKTLFLKRKEFILSNDNRRNLQIIKNRNL